MQTMNEVLEHAALSARTSRRWSWTARKKMLNICASSGAISTPMTRSSCSRRSKPTSRNAAARLPGDRRESARAHMRKLVKRLLKKYKYPPDEATGALENVMRQCELCVDKTVAE